MKQFVKSLLIVFAMLVALSTAFALAEAHAVDLKSIKVHKPKIKTYTVDGKQVNPAEALVAALNGKDVAECKPVELEIGTNGMPKFTNK